MRGRGDGAYGNRVGYGSGSYGGGYGGGHGGSTNAGYRGNENSGKGDLRELLSSRGSNMRRAEVASNGVGKCAGENSSLALPPEGSASDQTSMQTILHDVEDEEPFVAKYTASSPAWQRLQEAKSRLLASPESVWKSRALPKTSFTDQFRGCMAELDTATGSRLSLGANGRPGSDGSNATFLDLGCAPGGFSLHLLGRGLRGVGATLAPKPGFHAMDKRLDSASAGYELVTTSSSPGTASGSIAGEGSSGGGGSSQVGLDSVNEDGRKETSVKVYPASTTGAWTLHYADINDNPGGTKFLAPTALASGRGELSSSPAAAATPTTATAATAATAAASSSPEAHLFDVVIAGARFSKSGKGDDDEGGGGTRAVARLLTAQLLLALRHLKPGGHLVLVLNVTPLLTYTAPLALLRECFGELVACKPASCFEHRASCYVAGLGYCGTCKDSTGTKLLDPVARLTATLAALDEADRLAEANAAAAAAADGAEAEKGESRAGVSSSVEDRHLLFPCAPLVDTTGAALWVRHGAAIEQLMAPLWTFQASCIEALLTRAGVDLSARGAPGGAVQSGDGHYGPGATIGPGDCVSGCGFVKHPNPPSHFKAADRAYCCALCRTTRGKSHGGHCPGKGDNLPPSAAHSSGGKGKGGGGSGGKGANLNGRGRQSAPKAFGCNDHGDGLKPHEDLPEGHCVRLDDEGMVYALLNPNEPTAATATSLSRRGRGNPDDDDDDDKEVQGEGQGSATGSVQQHQQQQQQQQQRGGVYFCDRFRRYRFTCNAGGLALLRGLVGANKILLGANEACFDGMHAREVARQRQEGYALYEEKPTLQKGHHGGGYPSNSHSSGASASTGAGFVRPLGTWSDAEYALPGFQWMYLRLKSFQRFAETWALLERCAAGGLFLPGAPLHNCCATSSFTSSPSSAPAAAPAAAPSSLPVKVVSLGGGPGYELLAADWFFCLEAAVPSWTWQPSNNNGATTAATASCDSGVSSSSNDTSSGTRADSGAAGQWVLRPARELSAARAAWLSSNFPRQIPAQLPPSPGAPPRAYFSSLDLQVSTWLSSLCDFSRLSLLFFGICLFTSIPMAVK